MQWCKTSEYKIGRDRLDQEFEAEAIAKAAFVETEKSVVDAPFEWTLPLCPEEIRTKADEARKRYIQKPPMEDDELGI